MSTKQFLFDLPVPSGWQLLIVDQIKADEPGSCVAGPFGSNISSKYFVADGIPVIRGNNLRDDLTPFVPEGFVFVSEERATHYKSQHVKAGDLVFTCWGTLGQVGLIPENGPYSEYIISNKQLKLRPSRVITDPRFLFYYFACPQMVHHIRSVAIGAAVPGINLGILKALRVVLPPLLTQQKIVSILSAYDDFIENNTRRITILEEMAQMIYREWFVHFRFPGHEQFRMVDSELGLIPEGWQVASFTDIADVLSGGTPKTQIPAFWNGAIPFFTPKDVSPSFYVTETEKYITELGLQNCNSRLYSKDTVFITARGTVGKVVMPASDMAMNQSCYALKGRENIDQYFLFLTTRNCVDHLKQNTHGAVFDTIIVDTFRMLKVVKSPLHLIKKFKTFVSPLFGQVLNLLTKNTNLRQTRDLLLPKLISGEIDVENLDIAIGTEAYDH